MSSETIWHFFQGKVYFEVEQRAGRATGPKPDGIPHDPSDFGRCYRLLKAFPRWRENLPLMAEVKPEWRKLIAAWSDLEKLYEEEIPDGTGAAPKLYAAMKALR